MDVVRERESEGEGEGPLGLQAAKWISGMGALVIPAYISMKTGDKYPLIKDWARSGSRDDGVLEQWWRERGFAWPGMLGGMGSVLVFDADGPEAVRWFRELVARCGWDGGGGLVYRTPGRTEGVHVVFLWPGWLGDLHSAKYREPEWRGELQLRGRGTWTMLAGCKRPDGEYEMLRVPDRLEEAPRLLVETFLAEAQSVGVVGGGGGGDLRELSPEKAWASAPWLDDRKNAVAGLAWHLAIRGSEYSEVLEVCNRFAVECCEPALEQGVVQRKVDYTWNRVEGINERRRRENEQYQELAAKLFG